MGRRMTVATPVTSAVGALLDELLGDQFEAAFVYGSVARGTAGSQSDIDTFVITRAEIGPERRREIATRAVSLQADLGYQPDLEYPVEIFSVGQCVDLLHDVQTLRVLTAAGGGGELDAMTFNNDCLEVLRALLNRRLVIRDSPVLVSLTALANHRLGNAGASIE